MGFCIGLVKFIVIQILHIFTKFTFYQLLNILSVIEYGINVSHNGVFVPSYIFIYFESVNRCMKT